MIKDRLKKLFIPHEENGYKPDFLERFSMGIMLILVLLTFAISNIHALLWVGSDWMISSVLPAVIVNLTNDEREDDSLGTLKRNSILDAAAQMKADDMAEKGYFAHYSPSGTSPWYWFDQAGYSYVKAGENLAVHFNDSGKVVDAWMNSPSHRDNILNSAYTEIGVGTARGEYKGSKTIFVVQLFGTPGAPTTVTNTVVSNIETSSTSSAPQLAAAEQTDDVLGEDTVEVDLPPSSPPVDEIIINEVENTEPLPPPIDVVEVSQEESGEPIYEETYTEVTQEDGTTTLYSEVATTSREGIPATIGTDSGGVPPPQLVFDAPSFSSVVESVTQPTIWLQMVYAFLALIVVFALMISVVVEWRRQNPLQIAYAGGLLAVMALLFHVHTVLTSGVTII